MREALSLSLATPTLIFPLQLIDKIIIIYSRCLILFVLLQLIYFGMNAEYRRQALEIVRKICDWSSKKIVPHTISKVTVLDFPLTMANGSH